MPYPIGISPALVFHDSLHLEAVARDFLVNVLKPCLLLVTCASPLLVIIHLGIRSLMGSYELQIFYRPQANYVVAYRLSSLYAMLYFYPEYEGLLLFLHDQGMCGGDLLDLTDNDLAELCEALYAMGISGLYCRRRV